MKKESLKSFTDGHTAIDSSSASSGSRPVAATGASGRVGGIAYTSSAFADALSATETAHGASPVLAGRLEVASGTIDMASSVTTTARARSFDDIIIPDKKVDWGYSGFYCRWSNAVEIL